MEVRLANLWMITLESALVGTTFRIAFEGRLDKQRSRQLRTYILRTIFGNRSEYLRLSISTEWNT
jgi:hypothetical protein